MYHFYADESCKDTHRYLVLGGLAVEAVQYDQVSQRLLAVREAYTTFGEVKWSKVSKSKLAFYKAYVDVFFECARTDMLHFHSLVVDTHTFNHSKWNFGDAEIGFNKLIYQLLLHRFGRRYGDFPLHVYLDERSSKDSPDAIRPMLNSALAKDWHNLQKPFRRIHFKQSHTCQLIQLNDLLIGALGFRKNGRQHLADSSPNKVELAEYIARSVRSIQACRPNAKQAQRFTIWEFAYRK